MSFSFRFRIRLQSTERNTAMLLFINHIYNKVILKWKLNGEKVTTDAWETPVPASFDHFPFIGDVKSNVVFTNIGNGIQVCYE